MANTALTLAVLNDARASRRHWTEIASAVLDLEKSGPVDENGRPWIQRAESESGYTANQLRRMTRASVFLTDLIRSEPKLAETLLAKPFSHVEVISRIWRVDESEARKVIDGRLANNTCSDLHAVYERISTSGRGVAPVVAGKKAAKVFRDKALDILKRESSRLFGEDDAVDFQIMRPIFPFRYASPDYYIVCRKDDKVTRIEAIDCYALYDGSHTEIALRKMISVATEATFFSRFWIAVPFGDSASVILSECECLKLGNVGVIRIADGTTDWTRVPTTDVTPNPDRRDLWSDFEKARLQPSTGQKHAQ